MLMEIIDNKAVIEILLEKEATKGFGFNVVGGLDSQHIPGDSGIFITRIRTDTPAFWAKNLSEGDRIIAVNDEPLLNVKHEEAVEIFKRSKGVVKLKVESQGERTAINRLPDYFRSQSAMAATSTPNDSAAGDVVTGEVLFPRALSASPRSKLDQQQSQPSNIPILKAQRDDNIANPAIKQRLKLAATTTNEDDDSSKLTDNEYTTHLKDPPPPPTPTFESSDEALFGREKSGHSSDTRPIVTRPSTGSLLVEDPRGSTPLIRNDSDLSVFRKRDARYYAHEVAYTLVGLAAVTTIGYFVYKRFTRH